MPAHTMNEPHRLTWSECGFFYAPAPPADDPLPVNMSRRSGFGHLLHRAAVSTSIKTVRPCPAPEDIHSPTSTDSRGFLPSNPDLLYLSSASPFASRARPSAQGSITAPPSRGFQPPYFHGNARGASFRFSVRKNRIKNHAEHADENHAADCQHQGVQAV